MAQTKKRLSKNAKAALKLLKDSKLLANEKTIKDSKTARNFEPKDSPAKTTAAHKSRPAKKRG